MREEGAALSSSVSTYTQAPSSPQIARPQEQNRATYSINEMIKEKLDTMMNIKIMQMLEKNPDISITELRDTINPPPQQTFQDKLNEMKMLHDLVYKGNEVQAVESSGNEWLSIISNALPIIGQMLPNRNKQSEVEPNDRYIGNETGNTGICGLIPQEITRDTEQPSSISQEPRDISTTKPTNGEIVK